MEILIKVLQFVLSFSLLVIVHELGHFMFGRLFGVRVERFFLFFGKPIFSFKRGDTEYGIGWIPFGGYVKLAGMIDESMDTDQMKQPAQPYEFRTKPAWQRLLIMAGGVIMNVVLALVIYVGIIFTWGDNYLSTDDAKYGYVFDDLVKQEYGFRDGDKVLAVDGRSIVNYNELRVALLLEQKSVVTIERDGEAMELVIPETSIMKLAEVPNFMDIRYPFRISVVVDGGGAQKAGLAPGDQLVSLNGQPMMFFDEYIDALPQVADRYVELGVRREGSGSDVDEIVSVYVDADGKIGAAIDRLSLTPVHIKEYTFWQSIPAGVRRVGSEISGYWSNLKMIFKPKTEAYKSLGGPLSIGNIFPGQWSWYGFWQITALLSIILAVMNILPIPALDGGHILFLTYEMITGRKPSDNFLVVAQYIGLGLLFVLMIYATGNDIYRIFIK